MIYLPFTIITNLMEYWILILLTQYICSAHLNSCRKNVLIGSGIAAVCAAAGSLIYGEASITISMLLAAIVTILLFSRKKALTYCVLLPHLLSFLQLWLFRWLFLMRFYPEDFPSFFPAYLMTDGSV